MPDLAPVPQDLKVWEFLDFYADTHGLGGRRRRRERWEECLASVNLTDRRNAWCRALSRGQTQRLVLAKTLLHRPKVLILDEPASGLDPLSRRELRFTLQRLAADGATVFVSSHILSELVEMCTSLCVMNAGKILASGTGDAVRRQLGRHDRALSAVVVGETAATVAWLDGREGVHTVEASGETVTFGFTGTDEDQVGLLAAMVAAGVRVKRFEEKESSFEEILVEIAERGRG
jgi:ABC-2 type transport system ATP-binding protein